MNYLLLAEPFEKSTKNALNNTDLVDQKPEKRSVLLTDPFTNIDLLP